MASWYPGCAAIMDNGFGSSRGGQAITGAVVHHVAGSNGRDYVANWNSRNSHPTYHIAVDGRVTGIVHPDRAPSSTGDVDDISISFEVDNAVVGGNWAISEASLASLSKVLKWHADQSIRAGKPLELNDPAKVQAGFWVGWHSQYGQTACPGQHMLERLPSVVQAANSGVTPTPNPGGGTTTPPASGKLVVDGDLGPLTAAELQRQLKARGFDPGAIDGDIGPNTTGALQRYLKSKGADPGPIDGDWGPKTTRGLQTHLTAIKASPGPIDSEMGPQTVSGLQRALNAKTF